MTVDTLGSYGTRFLAAELTGPTFEALVRFAAANYQSLS